ncbi:MULTISPECIES: acyl carrier protein [Exiguobacterium]|uniref:acyl carrier protein n=1 Tax=Exiguobacterium TaxID=33986 RepID=UPI001BE6B2E3|nr:MULTISPECIES: acyl carrier protein [Exiguobacterium]MCT4783975.1 acyl carrier protein [Exiguobacterium himgiriensis]
MNKIELYKTAFINGLDVVADATFEEMQLGVTKEWDSIGHMTLIAELEDAFDVYIDSEWITEFNTYQSGIDLLKRLGVDFGQ